MRQYEGKEAMLFTFYWSLSNVITLHKILCLSSLGLSLLREKSLQEISFPIMRTHTTCARHYLQTFESVNFYEEEILVVLKTLMISKSQNYILLFKKLFNLKKILCNLNWQ